MGISSRFPVGTNVFERDWDALIILDTCRVDALKEVKSEYNFIEEVDSISSVGSTSSEWIANTFVEKYTETINNTAYVTDNAFAERVLEEGITPEEDKDALFEISNWSTVSADDLLHLDQPWRHREGPDLGFPLPEGVTDRAITIGREYDPQRLIVHYSQPHAPHIAQALKEDRDELYNYESDPFSALRDGCDFDKVWQSYLEHLRLGLDSVELLLENLDAEKVVITADHGDAFGEWGVYGHPAGVPHPKVRRVPWAVTHAEDNHTYEPEDQSLETVSADAKQRLKELGYFKE